MDDVTRSRLEAQVAEQKSQGVLFTQRTNALEDALAKGQISLEEFRKLADHAWSN